MRHIFTVAQNCLKFFVAFAITWLLALAAWGLATVPVALVSAL